MHRTLLAVIWPINSCIIVPTQGAETIIYIQPVMATAQGVFSATVSPGLKLPSIIKMIQGTSVQTSEQEIVEKEQHWDHRKVWCITNVHSINEHFHHKMRSRQHKALTCHSLMYLIEQVWCALPHGSAIDLLQFVDFFRLQISFFIGGHYCPTQFVVKHNVVFPSDFWDGLTLLLAASRTNLTTTFSAGRDGCSSVGAATPWVFSGHPGGSTRADWAGVLFPTLVIIYRAPGLCGNRAVMDSDVVWGSPLPMRVINIMKSYWACAIACDK